MSNTHFLKKMYEFAETYDTILDKGKQQGSEMLKKTLNLQGDTTITVLSDVQQNQCDPLLPTSNQTSTLLNTIHPSQAVTQEKCDDWSPMDAAIVNPSNGFSVVVVDNWDLRQEVRHMTSDHQNTDIHWVNHSIVENRISGNHLSDDKPVKHVTDVENKDLIPSIADHKELYNNYLVHIQRILTKRIPSLEGLSSNVQKTLQA